MEHGYVDLPKDDTGVIMTSETLVEFGIHVLYIATFFVVIKTSKLVADLTAGILFSQEMDTMCMDLLICKFLILCRKMKTI